MEYKGCSGTLERRTYNVTEVAVLLGIGRNAAYALVQSGQLRSVRVGRRLLIPRDAVDQFLKT